jgi:glycosyltransferase involved in cell wall biosynthesis
MIKVLHVIDSGGFYGAEKVLVNLLLALKSKGVDVELACMSPINAEGSIIGRKVKALNIRVEFLNERHKISIKLLYKIYNLLKKNKYHIVHVHGYKATIVAGIIALLCRIPFVSTYHGEAKGTPELLAYIKIENIVLLFAKKIIAVSKAIKDELIKRKIKPYKIEVIFNGVRDISSTNSAGKNAFPDNIHVICLGRLIELKRYDLVIDAIGRLKNRYPNILLTIAGNGPIRDQLEEKIRKKDLFNNVRLLGYVEHVEELYKSANIFIISSETEGCPITLLEAMCFSLSIISTNVGAIGEIIEDGVDGILIGTNDVEELADSIEKLIEYTEFAAGIGKKARSKYLRNFTENAMADKYLEKYHTVLNK